MQGIGQALMEQAVTTRTASSSPERSWITRSARGRGRPFVFETRNVPCKTNPLGVKGAGEAGAIGSCRAFVQCDHRRAVRRYKKSITSICPRPQKESGCAYPEHQRAQQAVLLRPEKNAVRGHCWMRRGPAQAAFGAVGKHSRREAADDTNGCCRGSLVARRRRGDGAAGCRRKQDNLMRAQAKSLYTVMLKTAKSEIPTIRRRSMPLSRSSKKASHDPHRVCDQP